ncbi:cytochrome P450 4d2-like [Aricia agestis]|uniref:cytochrome P450 4d2-like n=1 Tax=Aricia agestis TaxID=91739 RepID=UPI001C20345A|nr:cytochrome P450 4d2-like [Aricia agestis]
MFFYLLLAVLFISWWKLNAAKRSHNLPGPSPLPLLGDTLYFCVTRSKFLPLLRYFKDTYGDTCLIHLFHQPYALIYHPKYAEELLSSVEYINKGRSYQHLHPWLGDGLLTSTGLRWKLHRKFLTPAFHFNILQNFLQVFLKNEKILVKKLSELANGEPVNLFPIIALTALDNVTESIMGVPANAQLHSDSEYVKSIETISQIIAMKMRNPIIASKLIFNLSPYKKMQDDALRILHEQSMSVIENRSNELKNKNLKMADRNDIGLKNKHAFLDLLLLSEVEGEKMNIEHVREEVDTFMFEGHDTTTSGIAFTLYCISKSEEIQQKILDEQRSILGDDLGRDPTYTEIQQMKYLDTVIREGLRLYPSVPLIERMITKDSEISGLTIKKGSSVLVNILEIQRHPDLYDNPLEFRPERFEAGSSGNNAFNWLAFSAGPRNCIGQKFALIEMKVTISAVVKSFKLFPASEQPVLCADLILRSENGIKVAFTKRY